MYGCNRRNTQLFILQPRLSFTVIYAIIICKASNRFPIDGYIFTVWAELHSEYKVWVSTVAKIYASLSDASSSAERPYFIHWYNKWNYI